MLKLFFMLERPTLQQTLNYRRNRRVENLSDLLITFSLRSNLDQNIKEVRSYNSRAQG